MQPGRTDSNYGTETILKVWIVALGVLLSTSFGLAQPTWEMRVCADPFDYPASSREQAGYNNRIAEILADELGARLTYEWTLFTSENIGLTLLAGECDLAIGMAENAAGALTTVPYLRTPFVFVSLRDRGISVESLDDPVLESLTIGTYQTGIPSVALENRGITENVVEFSPVGTEGGADWDIPVLDAVMAGDVDVGIVYGPKAAARAESSDVPLDITPVTPEIDVGRNLLQHFRIWTIGVRPHDESFRDRLNLAMAARWDDIQSAIADYGVIQQSVSRPPTQITEIPFQVGLVAPTDSGGLVALKDVGMAALHGAELAESVISRTGRRGDDFRVLIASGPTDEAAARAAGRLVATENIFALIGGFGSTQAADLGQIADEAGKLFFNIASIDDALRGEQCLPTMFHIEASATMYADAALDWLADAGARTVFLVRSSGALDDAYADRLEARLGDMEVEVVGTADVRPDQFVFQPAITAASDSGADAILLAIEPEAQELFLAQAPGGEDAPRVTGLPFPASQTRAFLFRLRDSNASAGTTPRIALWDASIESGRAGELNDEHASRAGDVMEPTSWAAFAAVTVAYEAASELGSTSVDALAAFLVDDTTTFDVGKDAPLSFRAWDRQARQNLYAVRLDEGAQWSRSVRDRIGLAEVIATLPSNVDALDRYGYGPEATSCGR